MTEKTASVVVCLVTMTAWMVTHGATTPHTGLEHITLHLQPKMLRGHRLVLTLEPFPNSRARSLNTGKSLNGTQTLSNNTLKEEEDSTISTTTNGDYELTSTTPMPDITTETTEEATATDVSPIISKDPFSFQSDPDGLLLTVPELRCPLGFHLDYSGRCRPTFRPQVNRGRSIIGGYSRYDPFFGMMSASGNSLFKISEKIDRDSKV